MTTVKLLAPQGGLKRWHEALARALVADGANVSFELRVGAAPPAALALLVALERLVLARNRFGMAETVPAGAWLKLSNEPADLTFDLTGRPEPSPGAIFPTFDGVCGDAARDSRLLDRRAPLIGLAKETDGASTTLIEGLPALEQPNLLCAGQDAIAARLITLIRKVVRGDAHNGRPSIVARPAQGAILSFLATSVVERARRRLQKLVAQEGHWRVGWRRLANAQDTTLERLAWPNETWNWLDDDRRRYYADPFLFEHQGVVHVFCEEYPYETGRAVISHFSLDAHGNPMGAPNIVLERPYHLSYPLVFRYKNDIWMMPESSSAQTLELYRADPFPFRWTLDRVLMESATLSDSTVFEHNGRFWLTASTSDDGGSSWDCLSLFVGSTPVGPWSRCAGGPVFVDAAAARPAGHVVRRGTELWRPAQDCSGGYGSGIALCQIQSVDETGLVQTVARRLGPPPGAPAQGVHTLNAGFGFEIIDAVGPRYRFAMPGLGEDS